MINNMSPQGKVTVSVLMPVYNGERFLREAVQSVLRQTLADFELFVIDDGSTDGTSSILGACRDPRVKVIRQTVNSGIASALNHGLEVCSGAFIARMDADDISVPNRLAKQTSFLQEHTDVGILGSCCELIDTRGQRVGTLNLPLTDLAIRWSALLANPFAHPSTMIRRDVLERHRLRFNQAFLVAGDYDLWTRLLTYTRGANLDEPLIRYRIHNGTLTSRYRKTQLENRDRIALRAISGQFPGFRIMLPQVTQLRQLLTGEDEESADGLERSALIRLYVHLWRAFAQKHRGEVGLTELQRKEVLKLARILLRPPLPPGWWVVLPRLLALSPSLSLFLIARAPRRLMMFTSRQRPSTG